jgi:hypothetical protein
MGMIMDAPASTWTLGLVCCEISSLRNAASDSPTGSFVNWTTDPDAPGFAGLLCSRCPRCGLRVAMAVARGLRRVLAMRLCRNR